MNFQMQPNRTGIVCAIPDLSATNYYLGGRWCGQPGQLSPINTCPSSHLLLSAVCRSSGRRRRLSGLTATVRAHNHVTFVQRNCG